MINWLNFSFYSTKKILCKNIEHKDGAIIV